jgi:ubiquinone/menaquinone biosynthesis C-methylase UbiE
VIRKRMEVAYDRVAAQYAEQNAVMPPLLVELATRFLAHLEPGAKVLDAGCGDGRHMAWMEAHGLHVTGIDISTGMLSQARAHVQGELLQMDMCNLTFPPGSFAGIWCCASLLHIPKAQAPEVLRQMHNVLVPGGILHLGLQEGEGEKWEVTRFDVERFFARYTLEEAEALLTQTGFSVDERHQDTTGPRRWLNFLARAVAY